jgi:hypothetical protein
LANYRQKRPIKYETRRRAPGTIPIYGIPRDARLFYPVLIRRLTIGSVPWITSDPTVNPLHDSTLFGKRRTICNLTITWGDVKGYAKVFFCAFHTPVDAVQNHPARSTPVHCRLQARQVMKRQTHRHIEINRFTSVVSVLLEVLLNLRPSPRHSVLHPPDICLVSFASPSRTEAAAKVLAKNGRERQLRRLLLVSA